MEYETRELFAALGQKPAHLGNRPLADRMRPKTLAEFVGQEDITDKNGFFFSAIESDKIPSMIFWGPPGSGKTTLAGIIANKTRHHFVNFSAVLGGVKEVKEIVEEARARLKLEGKKTILFIDEIHRFNKAQQDAFLPHVEKGTIILIGATTENPSFELTPPLLSRLRVVKLNPLQPEQIAVILKKTLNDAENGLKGLDLKIPDEVIERIAHFSDGDCRRGLNALEQVAIFAAERGTKEIGASDIETILSEKMLRYDRAYEEHYNLISAFIKSMRGSDPDAAIYYAMRMLDSGENPRFILRRMIIFAAEDIGNADPAALGVAVNAMRAFEFVGLPEGVIPISQAVIYLATAPKSNASYKAMKDAQRDVKEHGSLETPLHLRNAPTKLMESLGYGKDYKYPHDFEGHYVEEVYLPEKLKERRYYRPSNNGYEKEIRERMKKK